MSLIDCIAIFVALLLARLAPAVDILTALLIALAVMIVVRLLNWPRPTP